MKQNILYSWKYSDDKGRSPLWYIIALSITIGIIIWGVFTGQYGMSIVVMMVAGFFFFLENNTEDTVQVSISDLGISVQEYFYDYSKIDSYNIIYDGKEARFLRLYLTRKGIKTLNLRVDTEMSSIIRPILSGYIKENPKGELSFIEKMSHLLKL